MVRIQKCSTCKEARPFVECDGIAVCYVCERTASGQIESVEASQARRKARARFDPAAAVLSWGQAHCFSDKCMKDVVPSWQGQSAFCPSCGAVLAPLSGERGAAIDARRRSEQLQDLVRACIYSIVSGVAAALSFGIAFGGHDSRIVPSIAIGLLAFCLVGVANRHSLGRELSAWLFKRSLFRVADEIVIEAARRSNVFVRLSGSSFDAGPWYPRRIGYLRFYEFRYGVLQLRLTCDGMIEVAAMAPREYGGGCMYPAPREWDMWYAHCGQGYRVPQSNRELFLSKVTESVRWLVDAQADFALGKKPKVD